MFELTTDILDFGYYLLTHVWNNPIVLGLSGFFILSVIFKFFYEMVGYTKC